MFGSSQQGSAGQSPRQVPECGLQHSNRAVPFRAVAQHVSVSGLAAAAATKS